MTAREKRPKGNVPGGASTRRALVGLSLVPGLGPGRIRSLISHLGSAARVFEAPARLLSAVPGIGDLTARAITSFRNFGEVDRQFAIARRVGARLLTEWDDDYPLLLKQIYDPPVLLWMRGSFAPTDVYSIAIVGTRRATSYGRHLARRFARELAELGFTITSGLAYGVDTAAHQGALEGGGRTIAVLGSGVDRIYPARNMGLARSVIENGYLLSEYPLGAAPDGPNFPRRNRIISGLSLGTVVVEAFEEGGAHITARTACEQNREVFAVPSPISRPDGPGSGCNRLIQRGHAKLVITVQDILDEFATELLPVRSTQTTIPRRPSIDSAKPLSREEQLLLSAISDTPIQLDTICSNCELDASTALVNLLGLEFKGLVRQVDGKQYVRGS